jgi:transcriptional regulator with XRE-family HTH domain
MREENMTFGKFIRKKRLESRRQYTLKDISNEFGISITMWCDIEQGRKNPGEFFDYEKLAYMLDLTESEKALMYDLAARKKGTVPSDIEDVMMYSESGNYARMALRMTNAGIAKEEDWREFIRQLERKKQDEQEG